MFKTAKVVRKVLVAIAAIACSVLVVVLLSSCGREEAEVATQTPAAATFTPAVATFTPVAVDNSWERIQAAGKIVVGTSADYPPFEWYVAPGQIDGFDIALMDEIGRRLGVQLVYVDYAFDALPAAAQAGQIDIAIAAISRTPEREALAGFSNVYLVGEGAALAQQAADITLTKLEDVAKYKVGLQRNSVYKSRIQTEFIDQGLMSPDNLFAYEKAEHAVQDLREGRVELVVMDAQAAQAFAEQGGVKVVGIGGGQQLYAIALPKAAVALRAKIDEQITALINEGFVATLSERYLGTPLVLPTPTPAPTSEPAPPPACVNGLTLVQHLTQEGDLKPGQAFTKGWQVQNTGTCPWTTAYRLVFVDGAKMGGGPVAVAREVKAGETYDVQVNLVAPPNPGDYQGVWQMASTQGMAPSTGSGQAFGERLKVTIRAVAGPTATPKPKPTPVPGVDFKVDRDHIKAGECVVFRWTVKNVKEYYFYSQFERWQDHPKTGDQGSEKECPQGQTTYYLRVIYPDNLLYVPEIPIYVEAAPEAPHITRFTVDPAGQITQGQCVAIRWTVEGKVNTVRLTANGDVLWDLAPTSGNTQDCPGATGPVAYLLEAVGPGGGRSDQKTITVVPVVDPITPEPVPDDPEIYVFSVTPNQVQAGDCVNVSWSVGGGTTYVRILRDGAPYWDPTEFTGQLCDTLDQLGDHVYQLLAGNVAKEKTSPEQWASVSPAPPQNPLAGTSWRVTSLQDGAVEIVPDAPPTANFGPDGRIDGSGACMAYGGSYRAEGDSLSISVEASSALRCDYPDVEARMAQDAAFLDLLPMATYFSLDGNQLLILDPGGQRLMELR